MIAYCLGGPNEQDQEQVGCRTSGPAAGCSGGRVRVGFGKWWQPEFGRRWWQRQCQHGAARTLAETHDADAYSRESDPASDILAQAVSRVADANLREPGVMPDTSDEELTTGEVMSHSTHRKRSLLPV